MHTPRTSKLLPVAMLASSFGSIETIDERLKAERRARHQLSLAKMSGKFMSDKERRHLEDAAGIGGAVEQITAKSKINRNAPCVCGSGKKYKKCCGVKI